MFQLLNVINFRNRLTKPSTNTGALRNLKIKGFLLVHFSPLGSRLPPQTRPVYFDPARGEVEQTQSGTHVRHWCSKKRWEGQISPRANRRQAEQFLGFLTNQHVGYAYCSPPYPINCQSCQERAFNSQSPREQLWLRPKAASIRPISYRKIRQFSFLTLQCGREGLSGDYEGEKGKWFPRRPLLPLLLLSSRR